MIHNKIMNKLFFYKNITYKLLNKALFLNHRNILHLSNNYLNFLKILVKMKSIKEIGRRYFGQIFSSVH